MTPAGWDHAVSTVLASLAESAVRALVLAAVVGTGLVLFRVKRAAIRLCAWTVVLSGGVALGVLDRAVPSLTVPVPAIDLFGDLRPAAAPSMKGSAGMGLASPVSSDRIAALERSNHVDLFGWRVALLCIYVAGVITLLLRVGIGWIVTRRMETHSDPVREPALLARVARHAATIGLARSPRVAESGRLFVPMTTSAIRPLVVLPADWRRWSAIKLDAVLMHELAHVARRDALTQRISLIYRAIFWFSPLSWWLHHQLAELAEQASDDAALAAGIDRTTYAETLVGFFVARPFSSRRADWHVAMARGADASAERRVEHVLAWAGGRQSRMKLVGLGIVFAVSPVLGLAAAIHPEPLPVESVDLPDVPTAPRGLFAVLPASAPALVAADEPAIVPPIPVHQPASTAVSRHEEAPAIAAEVARGLVADMTERPIVELPTPASADLPLDRAIVPAPPSPIAMPVLPSAPAPPVIDLSADVQSPTLVRRVNAQYTTSAMRAKIQGVVWLDVVVLDNGTVGDVKVVKSLDPIFGLDERAIAAAKAWVFQPGTRPDPVTRQRVPVSTVARLELEFRLH